MLYFYYGTDTGKSRATVQAAVDALRTRAPDATIEMVSEEVEALDLESLLGAQGLFYQKRVIVLDNVLARADLKEQLVPALPAIAESPHVFFLLAAELLPQTAKMIAKHAQKAVESGVKQSKKKDDDFKLADALQLRDRRLLWVELARRIEAGDRPEEIHGKLFWGAKSLLLAKTATAAEDAGLHPFVYRKAAARARAFSLTELQQIVVRLTELPHRARRRGVELEYELEHFALSLAEATRAS